MRRNNPGVIGTTPLVLAFLVLAPALAVGESEPKSGLLDAAVPIRASLQAPNPSRPSEGRSNADDDERADGISRPFFTCRPSMELGRFGTFTEDRDCLRGGLTFSVRLQSENVTVTGRDLRRYEVLLQGSGGTAMLTEVADGIVVSTRRFERAADFRLGFLGETGYFVAVTEKDGPVDATAFVRAIEGTTERVRAVVQTHISGGNIFLNNGKGPFDSWTKRVELVGFGETLTDATVKEFHQAGIAVVYFNGLIQDSQPLVKFLRVRTDFARGEIPKLSKDDILVKGPGLVARFVANFLSNPAADSVDVLTSISQNLANLESRLASTADETLRDIYTEIVAAKVFKLIRCAEAGVTGAINSAAFDECETEIDDLGEAISETPTCSLVCVNKTFDVARCDPSAADSFDKIDVIDELCDVNRDFPADVGGADNSDDAKKFVEEIERNLTRLKQRIWAKMLTFCKC